MPLLAQADDVAMPSASSWPARPTVLRPAACARRYGEAGQYAGHACRAMTYRHRDAASMRLLVDSVD